MASSDMGPLVTWGGALWPSSLSGRGVKGALAPPLEQHSQPFCTLAFSSGVCVGGGQWSGRAESYRDNTTDDAKLYSQRPRALVGYRSRFFTLKRELIHDSKVKTDINSHLLEK